jgi:hypothetical protein
MYRYSSVTIDLDLDDIYDQLTNSNKKSLMDWLIDDGIETPKARKELYKYNNLTNDEWSEDCNKLSSLYYQMSNEDIDKIREILKKY